MNYETIEKLLDIQKEFQINYTDENDELLEKPEFFGVYSNIAAAYTEFGSLCRLNPDAVVGEVIIDTSEKIGSLFIKNDLEKTNLTLEIILDNTQNDVKKTAHIVAKSDSLTLYFKIISINNNDGFTRSITQTKLVDGVVDKVEITERSGEAWENFKTLFEYIVKTKDWATPSTCGSCTAQKFCLPGSIV